MLFIRVRNVCQLEKVLQHSGSNIICGFILPKFNSLDGFIYLDILKKYSSPSKTFYAMPTIETPMAIYKEFCHTELYSIKTILDNYKDLILNIRIGGTDFSGIFGLRRDIYHTTYDLLLVSNVISDILNFFKRDNYIISAPVFEYFDISNPIIKSTFIKEISLDKLNGLCGKTIIHPNQIIFSNALNIISKEDYDDALSILTSDSNGVIKSLHGNKMNEVKPHYKWAKEIISKSQIWGVLNHGVTYEQVLETYFNLQL